MKKATIAMSGGVDSSVAALLTVQKGYECIGITMKLFDREIMSDGTENSCCSSRDIEDAKSVCDALGIKYDVLDFSADFRKEVIDRFINDYENGRTPNPCIDCNRHLKFDRLFQYAIQTENDFVVTGHYARIEFNGDRCLLKKAVDETKDQSYVLYSLSQHQLEHTVFPLGELSKAEVRELAASHGFINASKRDSQDICFVPNGKYTDFIKNYTKKTYPPGNYIDLEGNIIGTHKGIIHYTVGQHKGLAISTDSPMYVKSINPDDNSVTLCSNEELFSKTLTADNINLISVNKIEAPMRVTAKVRYRHREQPATVTQISEDLIKVEFDEPQRAITKGQAVVLYDGDIVVGGGTIK